MRVLILSQYFHPEPVPKPYELASALRDRGHEVSIVTGFPCYPSGKLYKGYRLGLVRRERTEVGEVVRTFELPYHGKSVVGRILNYASFMLSAPIGAMLVQRPDVIYVWHPPLTVGIAAHWISRMRRVPFVYDVQDIWPESAVLSGMLREGSLTVRIISMIERFVYKRAPRLLVVSDGARRNLLSKGVPAEKLAVMPHWVDARLYQPPSELELAATRRELGWAEDRFVVLFAGNLGLVQGLDTVIEAAASVSPEEKILFCIAGDGSDRMRLEELARSRDATDRVQFLGYRPQEKIGQVIGAADAVIVHLRPSTHSQVVIPTKTIAYMAAGRPVLMAMEGAAADLVRDAAAGITAEPGNPADIARGARALKTMSRDERAELGRNGRRYVERFLSLSVLLPMYEKELLAAAESAGTVRRRENATQQ